MVNTDNKNTESASQNGQTQNANDQPLSASDTKTTVGIWGMIGSVFAAVFGIQSHKNRERDFKKGNPSDFIVLGVIFVFLLVIGMIMFVNSVLPN